MHVKSFGCSFIFGNELADDCSHLPYPRPSQSTWPALIAKNLDYEYACYAAAGSGNLRIAERVLSQAACNEQNLYIIGWSWIDRFDYTSTNDRWTSLTPGLTSKEADVYYRTYHSQYRDKLSSLINIKITIDTLKQKNCPFIMTYIDRLLFEKEWHTTPAITDMQDYILPYMSDFNGRTFLEWTDENKFPIGKRNSHPLEEAHRSAADIILKDINCYIRN